MNTIQVRRGANASLPTLNAGEFGFSTDTHQVYIGDGATNHEIARVADLSSLTVVADSAAKAALSPAVGDLAFQTDETATYVCVSI